MNYLFSRQNYLKTKWVCWVYTRWGGGGDIHVKTQTADTETLHQPKLFIRNGNKIKEMLNECTLRSCCMLLTRTNIHVCDLLQSLQLSVQKIMNSLSMFLSIKLCEAVLVCLKGNSFFSQNAILMLYYSGNKATSVYWY